MNDAEFQEQRRMSGTGMRRIKRPFKNGAGAIGATLLSIWGELVRSAFDEMPYHVGSSTVGKEWHDIDVRLLLDDEKFDAMFPGYKDFGQNDAKWAVTCLAFSEWGCVFTGLPIDFQIQRRTQANEYDHRGHRNAIGLGLHRWKPMKSRAK